MDVIVIVILILTGLDILHNSIFETRIIPSLYFFLILNLIIYYIYDEKSRSNIKIIKNYNMTVIKYDKGGLMTENI